MGVLERTAVAAAIVALCMAPAASFGQAGPAAPPAGEAAPDAGRAPGGPEAGPPAPRHSGAARRPAARRLRPGHGWPGLRARALAGDRGLIRAVAGVRPSGAAARKTRPRRTRRGSPGRCRISGGRQVGIEERRHVPRISSRPLLAAGLAGAVGLGCGVALGRTGYPPLEVLLQGSETVLGQEVAYPAGEPVVTAAIVTMAPGQETGWHAHAAPLFAWMLAGELTVDYGPDGARVYRAATRCSRRSGPGTTGATPGRRRCGCWRCSWGRRGWRTR